MAEVEKSRFGEGGPNIGSGFDCPPFCKGLPICSTSLQNTCLRRQTLDHINPSTISGLPIIDITGHWGELAIDHTLAHIPVLENETATLPS